ncbi:MAG: tRNA-dihydrouridine synthase [Candidatus Paceibacterota bacterium]|jgi:nifR3 family TIM-barrel protein
MSFWTKLPKPFFALAPMADVTDAAFRQIVAKYSFPLEKRSLERSSDLLGLRLGQTISKHPFPQGETVFWTEQVSCDGLVHEKAREKLLLDLRYSEGERPIVAQFFGSKPENFYYCAKLASELGFDGVDINMGCPDKSVNKQKAGADLINNPELAREVIEAAKEGAMSASRRIPVSVKTRIGYNSIITEKWISEIIKSEPAAITIHGRTKKEMSKVPAHWDEIAKAAKLIHAAVNPPAGGILCIGNGDVRNMNEAKTMAEKYCVDGVMIGRGIFGNPWLFNPKVSREDLPYEERAKVMLEHAGLFEKLYKGIKPFAVMRKHFGSYMAGHIHAKELKIALMQTESSQDVEAVLRQHKLVI